MISLDYLERIFGWVNTNKLIQIINNPEVKLLDCYKDKNEHGIFRIIILKSDDIFYIFYGAGYHNSEGYIYDQWYFDIYLNYTSVNNNYSKRSVINIIKLEKSWFERKSKLLSKTKGGLNQWQEKIG